MFSDTLAADPTEPAPSHKLILHLIILDDHTVIQYRGQRYEFKRRLPMAELFTFLKGIIKDDQAPEVVN